MIDFANAYRVILRDGLVLQPEHSYGVRSFVLTEDDPDTKLASVKITEVPETSVLINLQLIQNEQVVENLRTVFKEGENLFRLCDYLLIVKDKPPKSTEPCLFFIFIEMKSKSLNNKEILEQFKGASSFIKYVDALLEYNWDYAVSNNYDIRTFYVIFYLGNSKRTLSWPRGELR